MAARRDPLLDLETARRARPAVSSVSRHDAGDQLVREVDDAVPLGEDARQRFSRGREESSAVIAKCPFSWQRQADDSDGAVGCRLVAESLVDGVDERLSSMKRPMFSLMICHIRSIVWTEWAETCGEMIRLSSSQSGLSGAAARWRSRRGQPRPGGSRAGR